MSNREAPGPEAVRMAQMKAMKRSGGYRRFMNNRTLFLMCLPAILFFVLFAYVPMPGLYIAFIRFNYAKGIFASPFIGLENFRFLVISGDLTRLTVNTIVYNLQFIIIGNIFQISMAIMLNELVSKGYRKFTQSAMMLPHFISYVVLGLFAYNIMNYDYGLLNSVIRQLGGTPLKIYSNPEPWPVILNIANVWKGTGYGSVVYFAAIMGLDAEMIEASHIDGANAFQRIRYILVPCLKPTFIILLLFSLGGIMRGNFGLFYNLVGANNSLLFKKTDIIETFVFRSLVNNFNFSMGSAVSLYQSVFGLVIVMSANWLVRKLEPEYALF